MKFQRLLCSGALVAPFGAVESSRQAASSALSVLKTLDYRYFVAGGTCAAFSHGITTPIDVVKTKIQANPQKYNKGLTSAAVDIIKDEGMSSLLTGLGPTVVGYGIEGAMKFGVYEIMKPVFAELLKSAASADGGNTAIAFLLASVVAGAVAALLLCPMESVRIKQVTDENYKDKNLITGLAKLTSDDGMGTIFASLWAMLAKQVPYTFGKQVSFDAFAKLLYQTYHNVKDKIAFIGEGEIKWVVSVVAAFLASLIACIFSQPGDMILTETYRPVHDDFDDDEVSKTPELEASTIPESIIINSNADQTSQMGGENVSIPQNSTPDKKAVVEEVVTIGRQNVTVRMENVTEAVVGAEAAECAATNQQNKNTPAETVVSATATTAESSSSGLSGVATAVAESLSTNGGAAAPPAGEVLSDTTASTASSSTTASDAQQKAKEAENRKFSKVIRRLYKDGGIPRFFTGTGARIVHVGAIITSQLVVYDVVKQLLGLPATGSH